MRRVIAQARRRVLDGQQVPARGNVVSLCAPPTKTIPRHKGGMPVALGRLVVVDEVAGGIGTRFAVPTDKTAEQGQVAPALAHQQQVLGRAPRRARRGA